MLKKFCNSFWLAAANEVSNEVDACNLVVAFSKEMEWSRSNRGHKHQNFPLTAASEISQVCSGSESPGNKWGPLLILAIQKCFIKKMRFFVITTVIKAVKLMSFILRLQPRETQIAFQRDKTDKLSVKVGAGR